jgi:hypothetical protein
VGGVAGGAGGAAGGVGGADGAAGSRAAWVVLHAAWPGAGGAEVASAANERDSIQLDEFINPSFMLLGGDTEAVGVAESAPALDAHHPASSPPAPQESRVAVQCLPGVVKRP